MWIYVYLLLTKSLVVIFMKLTKSLVYIQCKFVCYFMYLIDFTKMFRKEYYVYLIVILSNTLLIT